MNYDVTPAPRYIAAYFVYNIRASNFLGESVTFSKYCFIYVIYYVHETSTIALQLVIKTRDKNSMYVVCLQNYTFFISKPSENIMS